MHDRYSPINSIRSSRVGARMKKSRALVADSTVAFSRLNVDMMLTPYRLLTAIWALSCLRIAWAARKRLRLFWPGMEWA